MEDILDVEQEGITNVCLMKFVGFFSTEATPIDNTKIQITKDEVILLFQVKE